MLAATSAVGRDLSGSIREIETPHGAVLLDIDAQRCLALSPNGLAIWRQIKVNRSLEQIYEELRATYPNVPSDVIKEDTDDFITALKERNLLAPRAAAPQAVPEQLMKYLLWLTRQPSQSRDMWVLIGKALIGLLSFDLFCFRSKFSRVHNLVKAWPLSGCEVTSDTTNLLAHAVDLACVWYPRRVRCLQRSAVLTCLLRIYGIPGQMVIGAQIAPFRAHAWTEVNNCAINERRNVQQLYLVWERC
jgi:hypothetical protein